MEFGDFLDAAYDGIVAGDDIRGGGAQVRECGAGEERPPVGGQAGLGACGDSPHGLGRGEEFVVLVDPAAAGADAGVAVWGDVPVGPTAAYELPVVAAEDVFVSVTGVVRAVAEVVAEVAWQAVDERRSESGDDLLWGVPVEGGDPVGDAERVLCVCDGPAAEVAVGGVGDSDALAGAGEVGVRVVERDGLGPPGCVVQYVEDRCAGAGACEVDRGDEDLGVGSQRVEVGCGREGLQGRGCASVRTARDVSCRQVSGVGICGSSGEPPRLCRAGEACAPTGPSRATQRMRCERASAEG